MRLPASRLFVTLFVTSALLGCAGTVSRLSVAEVAKLSNVDLCYLNSTAPVGFIPLEIDRRARSDGLDCRDHHQAILDSLAKLESEAILTKADVPPEMVNRADCKDVNLGQVVMPKITETPHSTGKTVISDGRYHRYVINGRTTPTYVAFQVSYVEARDSSNRFIKIPANARELVRFGGFGARVASVVIVGCRSFR